MPCDGGRGDSLAPSAQGVLLEASLAHQGARADREDARATLRHASGHGVAAQERDLPTLGQLHLQVGWVLLAEGGAAL
eukprot:462675-Alexandrium_andersonii.AAC.1